MEQPRTRSNERTPHRPAPLPRPTRGAPPVDPRESLANAPSGPGGSAAAGGHGPGRTGAAPAGADDESAAVYRSGRPRSVPSVLAALQKLRWLRRMPGPKLTGLGCGLLALLLMLAAGTLDRLLPGDHSPSAYGIAFLVASAVCALWVRPTELTAAPVALPIAFFVGLVPVSEGAAVADRLVDLVTALALDALWLYAGTLLAVLTVSARKVVLLASRAAQRAAADDRGPAGPSRSATAPATAEAPAATAPGTPGTATAP
ncbi:DUF6542 domain-containing protein [Streptomyces sp. MNU89]|uniref:DUF6542 domain-containing protein n=1 Tax=Streptomyces sp. MNU89 TaxID=2560025 RepID=UPI001E398300|nr:DUF6542 domain-containing protein [Streptomyces sp. MNU89]MCC9739644.1 hypothetical protein [Streptomyces sp. MNU89]